MDRIGIWHLYLSVAAGSAIGGMARYWCYGLAARLGAESFPLGTLAVNVIGSTFIGLFAAITGSEGRLLVSPVVRQFVMAGICGGFTTFSTFSLETLNLARDGQLARAGANIALSLAACLGGVWLGSSAGAAMNGR